MGRKTRLSAFKKRQMPFYEYEYHTLVLPVFAQASSDRKRQGREGSHPPPRNGIQSILEAMLHRSGTDPQTRIRLAVTFRASIPRRMAPTILCRISGGPPCPDNQKGTSRGRVLSMQSRGRTGGGVSVEKKLGSNSVDQPLYYSVGPAPASSTLPSRVSRQDPLPLLFPL